MKKKLLLAAAGLALSAPALADGWHRGHYKPHFEPRYEPRHIRHYHPPVVVYRPAPVVYHYHPYYYQPAPVHYPVAPAGLSLSFSFPLN